MILRVQHLHKLFGGVHAVRDVNLEVAEHCIHAIIGPNGAGKTTLVRQLSGALKPDRGSIFFRGADITKRSAHQRARRGLVRSFQITSIIAPLSVLENAMLAVQATDGHSFRMWARVSRDIGLRERAMHALQRAGLASRAERIAGAISHGEQRQLEFAMALALNPKLLLLDEPMAGMSKPESARMIELLASLKGTTTIVLIEHDMEAVFTLADVTSVLVDGHIIASGDMDAIRNNREVQRAYLGAPA